MVRDTMNGASQAGGRQEAGDRQQKSAEGQPKEPKPKQKQKPKPMLLPRIAKVMQNSQLAANHKKLYVDLVRIAFILFLLIRSLFSLFGADP